MQAGKIRSGGKGGSKNTFRTSQKWNILSPGTEQCYCAPYFPLPSFPSASQVYCCYPVLQGGGWSRRDHSRLVKKPCRLIKKECGWIRELNHPWLLMPQSTDRRSTTYFSAPLRESDEEFMKFTHIYLQQLNISLPWWALNLAVTKGCFDPEWVFEFGC